MCMFSRKEKRLNVSLFVCKFACFNSASEAARKSIHSADTLSTLSIEGFKKKKNSYFSIQVFLAAGPSAKLCITVLFLL